MQHNHVRLAAVGPLDPGHGFPLWYQDTAPPGGTGSRLALALDPADPNTPVMGELPTPGAPVSFPGNFPDEAFYFSAEAELPVGGGPRPGRARVVMALEAAFGGAGTPAAGQQWVFARIRVRITGGVPNAGYVVTHPYGETDLLTTDEDGRVDLTEDLGAIGDFSVAVRDGQVAPFLRWTDGAPPGYLGDGVTAHAVTGSPLGQNFVRVRGPRVRDGGGPPDPAEPANPNVVWTDRFVVQGRLATVLGVDVRRAQYTLSAGVATIDVFAGSAPGQALTVHADGVPSTALRAQDGDQVARVTLAGPPPDAVTVTNVTDRPPTAVVADLVDVVTVTRAEYALDAGTLTVEATSSDDRVTTLTGTGTSSPAAPPATVEVTSPAGGRARRDVTLTGAPFPPVPVVADAGPDQLVVQGAGVTLDGRGSTGTPDTITWTADGGTVLTGADTLRAGFTAPAAGSTVTATLTLDGPGGTSSDQARVTVAALTPVTAAAGPDRAEPVGATVTLDGTGSTGASGFGWAPVAGLAAADLTGADTATPSFTMPAAQVTLELTATGPLGAPATDRVTIVPLAETVGVTGARFRTSTGQWRVRGSSDGVLPAQVTVRLTDAAGPVVGTAAVDAVGDWEVRVSAAPGGPPTPTVGASVHVASTRGGTAVAPVLVRS